MRSTRVKAILAGLAIAVAAVPASIPAQTPDDLFRPDVLHEVQLRVHSRDWARLRADYRLNTDYPCDFIWNGIRVPAASIRSRGNYTRSGIKPGLRVDFDRHVPGRRFAGQATLVLDNLLQDPSMMREAIATRVYARLGLPAPRESYARVTVNGRSLGLYAIVEAIDEPFLERTFGESSGYLFEYHWLDYWYFTYPGPGILPLQEMFEARTHTDEPPELLVSQLEELIRVANESDDDRFEGEVDRLVALDELVSQVAVDRLLSNIDWIVGAWGVSNLYLYRMAGQGRWRFVPWDLDVSLLDAALPVTSQLDQNALVRRAVAIPRLRMHFFDTLLAAADSLAEPASGTESGDGYTWFQAEVEETYRLVRDAALADVLKPYSNEEFEAEVESLRWFAFERPRFVRCQAAHGLGLLVGGCPRDEE